MDLVDLEKAIERFKQAHIAMEKNLEKRIVNQREEIKVFKRKQKKHLKIIESLTKKNRLLTISIGGNN